MEKLQRIVDSLNLRHKVCDLQQVYRSRWQGQALYVRLESGDLAAATQALNQGIAPEQFLKRFPAAEIKRDLLVVAHEQVERNPKSSISTTYSSISFDDEGAHSLTFAGPHVPEDFSKRRWLALYEKRGYDGPYVEAFYFPAGLQQHTLPREYARMVQYADCLIDTTAQIYVDKAKRTGRGYAAKESASETSLIRYVHEQTSRPSAEYDGNVSQEEQQANWRAYRAWDSTRIEKVDALAQRPQFRELLVKAATDAAVVGTSSDELEEYIARYYSPSRALELKRCRQVVGGCSQDDSPRRHALRIAQLSAETIHWEIFLRAHLDILNDHFERDSDGTYAWAERQTYLRELEELDINVTDLMLGISLQMANVSQHHYVGTPYRVGRALADTRQPQETEQRLLSLVGDSQLDTYNRLLAYYLFLNYNQHLHDSARQKQNVARLNAAVQKLPTYLVSQATVKAEK